MEVIRNESSYLIVGFIKLPMFPSKFGGYNIIPFSYRHTAVDIRQFQELGNMQQLQLIEKVNTDLSPLIPKQYTYSCLGITIHYLVHNVADKERKREIMKAYAHLIREAIRSRADNIRDETYPSYYMGIHGIIISNNAVRLILDELDFKMHTSIVNDNF